MIQKKSLIFQVGHADLSRPSVWLRVSIDLREQYDVRLEQGLDAFVVVDGLPIVPEESRQKLIKFLLKTKLNTVGKTREDAVHMPLGNNGMSEGYESQYRICVLVRLT